jgi:HTH-type transcriptional regulator/antitoxin HigA
MKTEIIVIQNTKDLEEARALVATLGRSTAPGDVARLRAQALILAEYEAARWPAKAASAADVLRYIMDQHDLNPADLTPVLGTCSRVSEVLAGKRRLSLSMIRRVRARFHVPADLLIDEAA